MLVLSKVEQGHSRFLDISSFLILRESTSFGTASVYWEDWMLSASVNAVSNSELSTRPHSAVRIRILSLRCILCALWSPTWRVSRNNPMKLYTCQLRLWRMLSRCRTSRIVSCSVLTGWQLDSNLGRMNKRYLFILSRGPKILEFSPIFFIVSSRIYASWIRALSSLLVMPSLVTVTPRCIRIPKALFCDADNRLVREKQEISTLNNPSFHICSIQVPAGELASAFLPSSAEDFRLSFIVHRPWYQINPWLFSCSEWQFPSLFNQAYPYYRIIQCIPFDAKVILGDAVQSKLKHHMFKRQGSSQVDRVARAR